MVGRPNPRSCARLAERPVSIDHRALGVARDVVRMTQRAERPWRKAWRRRSRARSSVRQRAGPALTMVAW